MSVTLASINLTSVSVGSTGTYNFEQVLASQSLPISTQMSPTANAGLLMLFNESNVGLTLVFQDSQHQINLPAGAWRRIPITASDRAFTWTVSYVIPNPLATILLIDYYRPGELIDEVGSLGNSPIGGSVSTTTTTRLTASNTAQIWADILWDSINARLKLRPNNPLPLGTGVAGWDIQSADSLGLFYDVVQINPNVGSVGTFTVVPPIAGVGGVAGASGSLGVPVTPVLVFRQHITVTTSTTIINYTPATTGFFRISGFVFINNGTSPNDPTIRVSYTDPDAGAGSLLFRSGSGTATAPFDGANAFGNGKYPIAPMDFVATAGVAITVTYQDPTNTPSDFISMVLEQVA